MPFENVRKVAEADFPTRWGHFRILGFVGQLEGESSSAGCESNSSTEEVVALVMGDIASAPPVVRIHSQCLTEMCSVPYAATAASSWS